MMGSENERGRFIVFEGIDGSGKSTQVAMLAEALRAEGKRIYTTFEPTKRPVGALLRQVLTGKLKTDEATIAALFLADRLDHIHNEEDGLLKHLNEGTTVISDRYYFSSYAYHSVHVPMDWVIEMNSMAAQALRPDLVIYLDISPAQSLERIAAGRDTVEHYEEADTLKKVRENYLEAFERMKEVEKIVPVDAGRDVAAIAAEILALVKV